MPTAQTRPEPRHSDVDCASFLLFVRQVLLEGDDEQVVDMLDERLLHLASRDQRTHKLVATVLHEAITPPLWPAS